MTSEVVKAIKQIAEEKGIPYESVIETVESALAAAYRKDFGNKNQNIKVEFDPETGASRVFDEKTVVTDELFEEAVKAAEERKKRMESGEPLPPKAKTETEEEKEEELKFHPKLHISLSEAKKLKKKAKVDEMLKIELPIPAAYGRMAAQTAKQVIIQKLREAEREIIFSEFKKQEHSVINGTVQRREGRVVLVDVGRTTAIILPDDQILQEKYNPGQRIRVYVSGVNLTPKGPEILVSRTHPEIVKKLFELEIPEIANGSVIIKGVAREAGARSKIAVYSQEKNIDPVGSCIGQRGTRIQTIISELGGEKIDVIEFNESSEKFIANSLSPAKILKIETKQDALTAMVYVAPEQYSIAIGKGGQNVRLASKLTGWRINVLGEGGETKTEEKIEATEQKEEAVPEEIQKEKTI